MMQFQRNDYKRLPKQEDFTSAHLLKNWYKIKNPIKKVNCIVRKHNRQRYALKKYSKTHGIEYK